MRVALLNFTILALFLSVFGCAKSEFQPLTKSTSEQYIRPQLEEYLLTIPESERAFVLEYDAAAAILVNYLNVESGNYVLNISESQAKSLGVSKEMYDLHSAKIKKVNESINTGLSRGREIIITDPQKTLARYNDPTMHTRLENKYNRQVLKASRATNSGKIYAEKQRPGYGSTSMNSLPYSVFICECSANSDLVTEHKIELSVNGTKKSDNKNTKWLYSEISGFTDYTCAERTFRLPLPIPTVEKPDSIIDYHINIKYENDSSYGGNCKWALD